MNSIQIENFFQKLPLLKKHFRGIFALNYLENIKLKQNEFCILNTCQFPSSEEMCHWTLLINHKKKMIYFDSFGIESYKLFPEMFRFVKKHKKPVLSNKFTIQHYSSKKCGQFVCVYAVLFYMENKIPNLRNYFSLSQKKLNDVVVEKMFEYIHVNFL